MSEPRRTKPFLKATCENDRLSEPTLSKEFLSATVKGIKVIRVETSQLISKWHCQKGQGYIGGKKYQGDSKRSYQGEQAYQWNRQGTHGYTDRRQDMSRRSRLSGPRRTKSFLNTTVFPSKISKAVKAISAPRRTKEVPNATVKMVKIVIRRQDVPRLFQEQISKQSRL